MGLVSAYHFFAQVHLWYYSSRPGAPSLFLRKLNDSLLPPPQDTWELLHRILARQLQALPDMLPYKLFGIWFRYHIIRWAALPTIPKMIYWPGLELSIL